MNQRTIRILLCLLFAMMPVVIHADELQSFKSRHYDVYTDIDLQLARQIASRMDMVHAEYARRLVSFVDHRNKRAKLYLFSDQPSYLSYLADRDILATNTAGIFFTTASSDRGLATWLQGQGRRRMVQTLQHEGFHQFADARLRNMLPWINEGLAEYFSHSVMVGSKLKTGQSPPDRLQRLQYALKQNRLLPFRKLLTMNGKVWITRVNNGDENAGLMYDQAWSVTHFLIHARNGQFAPLLEKYMHALARGVQPRAAFKEAFGSNMAQFENAWKAYLSEQQPDVVSTAMLRLGFMAQGIKLMHETDSNITIKSIDELRSRLQKARFRVTRGSGKGPGDILKASQFELFLAPKVNKGKRRAIVKLEPARQDFPPAPMMTNLGSPRTARIKWVRDPDGSLTYDFEFK